MGWLGGDEVVTDECVIAADSAEPEVEMGDFDGSGGPEPGVEMVGDFDAARRYRRTVFRSNPSSLAMRRRDQPCAASCSIALCTCTLSMFAMRPTDMPANEHSAQPQRLLKVGDFEMAKIA